MPNNSSVDLHKTVSSREIIVYVAGAVEKPGLVHLPADARLDDALKQVRPLLEANLESMNPAEKLKDGQKVSVPYKSLPAPQGSPEGGTVNSGGSTSVPAPAPAPAQINSSTPVATQASAGITASADGKININTAGAAELDKLTGIGPAFAERIIQYRTEHGPFVRAEDLKNVSGIGVKTYERMASQVTVGP
ncbi:helix-hairpin-helix domain-containing protein [Desulfosporosinus burensis]